MPATQSFVKSTMSALASVVHSLFTMSLYTAGALWRMRLDYNGKNCTARWLVTLTICPLSHMPYTHYG